MHSLLDQFICAYRRTRRLISHIAKTDYPLNQIERTELEKVIVENRRALRQIPVWLDHDTLDRSVFRYGITNKGLPKLDELPGAACTYADLLVYFMKHFRKPLSYLELGVSVGKTFWQVLANSDRSHLVGFDIETINPALERHLERIQHREWPVRSGSIKKTATTLAHYRHAATGSDIHYLCGDIFDPGAWEALQGRRFNLILSDALHSAEALETEWQMLQRFDLLDPKECVVLWDDLDGPMHDWFLSRQEHIAAALRTDLMEVRTLFLNGWLGEHEWPHRVGIAIKGVHLGLP